LISESTSALANHENGEKHVAPDNIPGVVKVDAEGLITLVERMPDLIMIDARIAKDREYGYIEGSRSLPNIDTNCETLAILIPKKTTPTVYYCNGPKCGRSVESIKIAKSCGYSNIYWYRGGFEDWKDKNYPFLKDAGKK